MLRSSRIRLAQGQKTGIPYIVTVAGPAFLGPTGPLPVLSLPHGTFYPLTVLESLKACRPTAVVVGSWGKERGQPVIIPYLLHLMGCFPFEAISFLLLVLIFLFFFF